MDNGFYQPSDFGRNYLETTPVLLHQPILFGI